MEGADRREPPRLVCAGSVPESVERSTRACSLAELWPSSGVEGSGGSMSDPAAMQQSGSVAVKQWTAMPPGIEGAAGSVNNDNIMLCYVIIVIIII